MDNLHIPITGDNKNFLNALNGARDGVRRTARDIEQSGMSIEQMFNRIQQAAAISLAGFSVKEFVQKVVQVRGEFQQLEVAFTTMLGSAEKANALMQQLVNTAAKTPFDLQGVAEGAKQLLAYGEAAENINEDLNRLGNIAAGMSLPLSDLIYLYGTTMSQGRLYARDVLQFSGRGIPLVQELQKQFGATREEINKMVSEGKIGFPQVKAAIVSMTSSGGQFYNLMEEQSKTITGQISNLQDSLDMMFNEIGKKSEGIINDAISAASFLVEHYEQIGNVLKPLVVSYGAYKAALIATAAVENLIAAGRSVKYFALLTTRIGAATAAQRAFNVAALKNPYVILGAAAASLIVTLAVLSTRTNEYTEELEKSNRKLEEQKKQLAELDEQQDYMTEVNKKAAQSTADQINKVEVLKSAIEDETNSIEDRKKAIREMQAIVPNYEASLNEEGRLYVKNKSAVNDYIESLKQLAIAKALQSKREELTAQQIDAELNRRQAVRDRKKAADEARDAARATEEARRKRNEANERGRQMRGGGLMAGFEENIIASRADDLMNSRPVQLAMDAEAAANAKLRVAQNAVTIADKTILTTSNQIRELDALLKDYKNKGLLPEERTATTPTDSTTPRTPKVTKEDPRIRNEKEIAKAILDLQDANEKEQIDLIEDGTEKRLALSKYEYEQRKEELKRQHKELVSKRGGNLTENEEKSFTAARQAAHKKYLKDLADAQKEELSAMYSYLKEYGSFEQQKLAITEDYEQKIRDAQTNGEKLRLTRERDNKLANLSFESVSMGIDWSALLNGVGNLSQEMLKPMLEQLEAYTKTDAYRDASMEEREKVSELIDELRNYVGTDQSTTWEELAQAISNFTASVAAYKEADKKEQEAVAARDEGKKKLERGEITQADFDALDRAAMDLGDQTARAKEEMQHLGQTLNETSDKVRDYVSPLTTALNKAGTWAGVQGMDAVKGSVANIDALKGALDSALPSMGEGMAKTIGSGLTSALGSGLSVMGEGLSSVLSSGLGGVIGIVAQIPRLILDLVGNVKSMITGVLDSITELLSLRWIDDLVVSILDAVGNLIDAIFDLPENLYKVLESIVVNGVGGLLNSVLGRVGNILSLGALDSGGPASWFTNSNEKEVTDTINRLTERNKLLQQSIEDLTDEMKTTRGEQAISASREAEKLQKETNENYKQMAQAQAGYHSAHHSWNYYWDGYNQEQISRLSGQIGRSWNGDIWDLSPEEMKQLRSNVDMWKKIGDTGEGGYGGRVQEILNNYIEQAGKLEEITNTLYENLTTTTKENVFDDFLNSLYDLADGSEDVFDNIADNWQAMVNRMVVNNLIGAKFQQKLEEWYEELAKLNEAKTNGDITDEEYRAKLELLKKQYEGYVTDAQRDIETLRNEGIIDATSANKETYEQDVSKGSWQSLGEETGQELNGRFAALQVSGEKIADGIEQTVTMLTVISTLSQERNTTVAEIRNLMIFTNAYLEDILKCNKEYYAEFKRQLDKIQKSK